MPRRDEVTLLVGTTNQNKLAEISRRMRAVDLGPFTLRLVGLDALSGVGSVEETGTTFEQNAAIKARAFAAAAREIPAERRPQFVVADDSGLRVDALDGAPGVYSSRYAGPTATHQDNNQKLLEALADVPQGRRQAEFVCVMACVCVDAAAQGLAPERGSASALTPIPEPGSSEDDALFYAEGRCPGEILFHARGQHGFGYDPLFFYAPLRKSFAELTGDEKNAVSHRGRALDVLGRKLTELLALKGCKIGRH